MMLHNKYQGSRLCVFRQEDFFLFSLYKTHEAGPFLTPGSKLNKLGRCPLGDAKYQISRLLAFGFRKEDFFIFPDIILCKTCDPQGRSIFGPRSIIQINLVEVH